MTFCFDLDGTLCTNTDGNYESAKPFEDRIRIVNSLFEKGNIIIIDTARGSTTKIDWYEFTEKQLKEWGILYTKLRVGIKPFADFYIDDKSIDDKTFFSDGNIKFL